MLPAHGGHLEVAHAGGSLAAADPGRAALLALAVLLALPMPRLRGRAGTPPPPRPSRPVPRPMPAPDDLLPGAPPRIFDADHPEDAAPPLYVGPPPRRLRRRRKRPGGSSVIARAAALGLALAAGLGGTAFAGRLPAVDAGPASVAPVRLDIPAATPALVCPGPETAVVPDGAVPVPAPGPFTVTAAAVATGAAAGSTGGDAPVLGPLATRRGGAALEGAGEVRVLARVGDPHGPLRLAPTNSSADAAAAARLAAVQVTLARSGDLRGLAAGQCGAAAADAWLVGGATTPGRRARLLLANPTPAPAVVDVRLAGPKGPVDVPSGRGLVVAPGRVRAVLLDAAAPGLGQLAVHVIARSGRVTSLLHDSWLRGAVPAGTDDVLPSAAPSRHVVVPGVVVLPGGAARLRVAATGSDDAVVRYHLLGPAGDVEPPGTGVLTVPAGGVADVSLRWVRPGRVRRRPRRRRARRRRSLDDQQRAAARAAAHGGDGPSLDLGHPAADGRGRGRRAPARGLPALGGHGRARGSAPAPHRRARARRAWRSARRTPPGARCAP